MSRAVHRLDRSRPPRASGVALRWHLVALLVVPLLTLTAFGVALVDWRVGDVARADRVQQQVVAAVQLDAARGAVQREALPALLTANLSSPHGSAALGLSPADAHRLLAHEQVLLRSARRTTDAALRAASSPLARVNSAPDSSQLAALRQETDARTITPAESAQGFLSLAASLAAGERAQATAAATDGLATRSATAGQDLATMALLSQYAGNELPLLLSARLLGVADAGVDSAYLSAWGTWTGSTDRAQELSGRGLLGSWYHVVTSTSSAALDVSFARYAASPTTPVTLADAQELVTQSAQRDAGVHQLVASAARAAEAAADASRLRARRMVALTLAGALLALLGAAAGVVLVSRTTAGSLAALARVARRIGDGDLVTVPQRGPSEVRTVAGVLATTVDNLRHVQAQAEAVATGDLDHPVLSTPLPGPLGEVVHASLQRVVTAVAQRESMREHLAHTTSHDALTGLANRAESLVRIDAALARAARTGARTGVMLVDLDGFKPVNDLLGPSGGDEVLRTVAARLLDCVRAGDAVGRLGGDEFVVLVEHVESERALVALAERIIEAVSEPVVVGERRADVGASVGIAVAVDGPAEGSALLHEADVAVHRVKTTGRGRVEVFDDALRSELAARDDLETGLRRALDAGGLGLAYQPVWARASSAPTIEGFEALCRWDREGVGPVRPDVFIAVAEESDLVCDLGRWALHEATAQLASWLGGRPSDLRMAVNVSGRHIADPRVIADVTDALAASGLAPAQLVVEVTETVLVDSAAAALHMDQLRALGCLVAIDDFGTGYTAIGQLATVPADILKIDRSLVIASTPGDAAVLALTAAAAHSLGLQVVAEGVETSEQLQRVSDAGCDLVQGYLLGRPLPVEAAGELLTAPDRTSVPGADHGKSIQESVARQATSGATTDRGLA